MLDARWTNTLIQYYAFPRGSARSHAPMPRPTSWCYESATKKDVAAFNPSYFFTAVRGSRCTTSLRRRKGRIESFLYSLYPRTQGIVSIRQP